MISANAGEAVAIPFLLLDFASPSAPVTGASNGDFTARLLRRGVDQGDPPTQTVTVTEVSVGRYLATFTPDEPGHWFLTLEHDPSGRQFDEDIAVGLGAIAQAVCVDNAGTIHVRAWLERDGRRVLDATSATLTLYDDTGTSVGVMNDAADDGAGYFIGTFVPSPSLVDNRTYGAVVSITDPAGTVTTAHGQINVSTGA